MTDHYRVVSREHTGGRGVGGGGLSAVGGGHASFPTCRSSLVHQNTKTPDISNMTAGKRSMRLPYNTT